MLHYIRKKDLQLAELAQRLQVVVPAQVVDGMTLLEQGQALWQQW